MWNVRDLVPGMDNVDIEVEVADVSKPKKITMSSGAKRDVLELEVKDRTGAIALTLWDDKIIQDLKVGDSLQIRNGYVTSYRGEWRINVGRYGEIEQTKRR